MEIDPLASKEELTHRAGIWERECPSCCAAARAAQT